MKYMGSKNRIAKDILPIILKDRKPRQYYVEPFVGGANLIDKVPGQRIGSDLNKYLIALWRGLQQNEDRITHITKDIYSQAREDYKAGTNLFYSDFLIGWIGFMGSYNGRFFDGGYSGHNVKGRDYIGEQIRNTIKQIPSIQDILFVYCNFLRLRIPENSIIYCDIPYLGTKEYTTSRSFDHDIFWDWVRIKVSEGHSVFVSEYQAPDDFVCVWEKEVTNSMHQKNTSKPTEKLFVFVDQYLRD